MLRNWSSSSSTHCIAPNNRHSLLGVLLTRTIHHQNHSTHSLVEKSRYTMVCFSFSFNLVIVVCASNRLRACACLYGYPSDQVHLFPMSVYSYLSFCLPFRSPVYVYPSLKGFALLASIPASIHQSTQDKTAHTQRCLPSQYALAHALHPPIQYPFPCASAVSCIHRSTPRLQAALALSPGVCSMYHRPKRHLFVTQNIYF